MPLVFTPPSRRSLLTGAFLVLSGTLMMGQTQIPPVDELDQPRLAPVEPTPLSTEPQTEPATGPLSAEALMDVLQKQRQAPPQVLPTQPAARHDIPARVGLPASQVDLDPAILGLALDQPRPALRREGEFLISRQGRLQRTADGQHVLFVLDADDPHSPELPLILQRCQLLENMEQIVAQQGEQVRFILSGQIHTYRGANYLLPTMMNLAANMGNL